MITRPLDLAAKMRPEPRGFDALFYVNVGVLALFFLVFGSRFVLAPGLGVDFQLPTMPGVSGALTTSTISVKNSGTIFADGLLSMGQLRDWLKLEAKKTRHPSLLVRMSSGVSVSVQNEIVSAARDAGFGSNITLAAEEPATGQRPIADAMNAVAGWSSRWMLALGGALVAIIVVALLFVRPARAPALAAKSAAPLTTTVRPVTLIDIDLRKTEAALTDPTPLFLPTEWNAGQNALPANTQREPGGSFQGYPAKLSFAEEELKLNFPADVVVPARPADALASDWPGQSFLGMGRTEHPVTQLVFRKAFVEILDARNGQRLLAESLADAQPPGEAWQPLEFLVAVDAMGLVGPPTLTESSRVAAVDGYFQNYLVKTLHAGQRLAPGFYRVCIGP